MAASAVAFFLRSSALLLQQEAQLLSGVGNQIQWIRDELQSMQAFLKDADSRKDDDEGLGTWVQQVRQVVYDVEDILDVFQHKKEFMGSLNFFRKPWILHGVATKLKDIEKRVRDISERSIRYGFNRKATMPNATTTRGSRRGGTSFSPSLFLEESDIVGLKKETDLIVEYLVQGDPHLTVVSVIGMGGLGKTTLASKVYNDERVRRQFDCFAWESVSQSFNTEELLKSMLAKFLKVTEEREEVAIATMRDMPIRESINHYLKEKRYLIVLDDVWSGNVWDGLMSVFPKGVCGSRILATTRKGDVASPINVPSITFPLQPLSDAEAWDLFCIKAFQRNSQPNCPPELVELSHRIVNKCEGLPLAIVALGRLLSKKPGTQMEWKKVLDSLNWRLSNHPMLQPVRNVLQLSYNDLPCYLQTCFLYCSIFPEDYTFAKKKLMQMWIAEGFIEETQGMTMEEMAEEFLVELIERSMLQATEMGSNGQVKSCRVHDLVRELALSVSNKENFGVTCLDKDMALDAMPRRIAIHNDAENIPRNAKISHLRSFLVFASSSPTCSFSLPLGFRLLRVLDLQGVLMDALPSEIAKLFHLRYLGLKGTQLKRLSSSLYKLQSLQTLDIRETHVKNFPKNFSSLCNLRHLNASAFYRERPQHLGNFRGLHIRGSIQQLGNLQTLAYVEANDALVVELKHLTQLRKLGVLKIRCSDGVALCASIENMNNLLHLVLASTDSSQPLQLESLHAVPRLLQKLELGGTLEKLPNWVHSLHNLTKLRLMWSQLKDDPLVVLEALPNLVNLDLHHAYIGSSMYFGSAKGFPRLKSLTMVGLNQLMEVKMSLGAMPCLQKLHIGYCKELVEMYIALGHLTALGELVLVEMSDEFVGSLVTGERGYRPVDHIAKIDHYFVINGEWIHECIQEHHLCFEDFPKHMWGKKRKFEARRALLDSCKWLYGTETSRSCLRS